MKKTEWIDEAIRHLKALCKQAAEYADDDDIVPEVTGVESAIDLMKQLHKASAPTIAITGDGEIVLTWQANAECFKAYIAANGKRSFYQNQRPLEARTFTKYLTAVPA